MWSLGHAGAGCLWVLENNLRQTSVVRAFSAHTGREVAAWPLAGANCHNLHWHEGGLLYLTSQKVDATLLARHAPLLQVQVLHLLLHLPHCCLHHRVGLTLRLRAALT